jgi:hypothetical protein
MDLGLNMVITTHIYKDMMQKCLSQISVQFGMSEVWKGKGYMKHLN